MRARHLLPTVVVLLLAVLTPVHHHPDPCASTDGPQYRCWLERQQ